MDKNGKKTNHKSALHYETSDSCKNFHGHGFTVDKQTRP